MRGTSIILAALGLSLAGALIAHQGLASVTATPAAIGSAIPAILLIHVLQLGCSGLAWAAVLGGARQAPARVLISIRWIRESLNSLLPTAQIGGEIVGVRLLALRGVARGSAAASLIVDLTMELASQLLFTLLGLILLLLGGFGGAAVRWVAVGLLVSLATTLLFAAAQQRGLFRWVEQVLGRLARRWSVMQGLSVEGLHDRIQAIYRARRGPLRAASLHLLGWLLGAAEVWVILRLLGVPATLQEAMVLESLGQAVRSAAFVVPAGLGLQEGGFMLLGALYGLPAETGLALSILKRVREVALGIPGMLAWQLMEARRRPRHPRSAIPIEVRD